MTGRRTPCYDFSWCVGPCHQVRQATRWVTTVLAVRPRGEKCEGEMGTTYLGYLKGASPTVG